MVKLFNRNRDINFKETQICQTKNKTAFFANTLLAAVTDLKMEHSKQEKEIYELAELLMQSENLEASATILRDFAEKCYQEGAIDAQNDSAKEIREHYVEGGR